MEPESVLIIATVFVLINTGVVLVCELFRDSTADTVLRDTISRIICPSNMVVSVLAMIGAQKRKSVLLLPFLVTLALFMVSMALGVVYLVTWCPYQLSQGGSSFVCSMAVIMGATCIAGLLFGTCQTYIVLSLFKFLRYGPDDTEENAADIELTDKLHDHDDPSTSY